MEEDKKLTRVIAARKLRLREAWKECGWVRDSNAVEGQLDLHGPKLTDARVGEVSRLLDLGEPWPVSWMRLTRWYVYLSCRPKRCAGDMGACRALLRGSCHQPKPLHQTRTITFIVATSNSTIFPTTASSRKTCAICPKVPEGGVVWYFMKGVGEVFQPCSAAAR